jgi:hypothetical protein
MDAEGRVGSDVVFSTKTSKPTDGPTFAVSVEKNEGNEVDPNSDNNEEWDVAKGVVGFYCRVVHHHYYLVALAWLCICIAMTAVVMFGPSDERCVGPNGAPGQMQVCR